MGRAKARGWLSGATSSSGIEGCLEGPLIPNNLLQLLPVSVSAIEGIEIFPSQASCEAPRRYVLNH